jgi:hypothetical protein
MDNVDQAFAALGKRISRLRVDAPAPDAPPSLSALIARVDAAKRAYRPGVSGTSPAAR